MLQKNTLAAIYEKHYATVYMVAVGYGLQRSDCEDIVHDTFMRLIRYEPEFKNAEHEKAWLIVAAGNLCKNLFRKSSSKDLPLEDWDAPYHPNDEGDEVIQAVRSLPERLRQTVHLYYYEGYKSHEIAEMLKLHPASVRRQLVEARDMLKERLGGTWE